MYKLLTMITNNLARCLLTTAQDNQAFHSHAVDALVTALAGFKDLATTCEVATICEVCQQCYINGIPPLNTQNLPQ
jgi:hypothetical protein